MGGPFDVYESYKEPGYHYRIINVYKDSYSYKQKPLPLQKYWETVPEAPEITFSEGVHRLVRLPEELWECREAYKQGFVRRQMDAHIARFGDEYGSVRWLTRDKNIFIRTAAK